MKLFALPILLLAACSQVKHDPIVLQRKTLLDSAGPFPKYVHNVCTGKWAVQTSVRRAEFGRVVVEYFGITPEGLFFLDQSPGDLVGDTCNYTELGLEATFPSQSAAVAAYGRFEALLAKRAAAKRAVAVADSIAKYKIDSAYKCEHTYQ